MKTCLCLNTVTAPLASEEATLLSGSDNTKVLFENIRKRVGSCCTFDCPCCRLSKHCNTRSKVANLHDRLVAQVYSHRVTESQSHRVTESQSHRVTESPSHRVRESHSAAAWHEGCSAGQSCSYIAAGVPADRDSPAVLAAEWRAGIEWQRRHHCELLGSHGCARRQPEPPGHAAATPHPPLLLVRFATCIQAVHGRHGPYNCSGGKEGSADHA